MREWMNCFEGVETPNWPREINSVDLLEWIEENHHNEDDIWQGDLTFRVERFDRYVLQRIPLSALNLDEWTVHDDLVSDYEALAHLGEAPPIVFDPVNNSIIDGTHRANAAEAAGRKDILAYVGDPESYDDSEPLDEAVEDHAVPVLYHATPMYRYDPDQAKETGVWPNKQPISKIGLVPSQASHLYEASIYLSDSPELCANYASNNFGEEYQVDWVVLRIDPSAIDTAFLRSDLHQEASIHADEILALGFTEEDWDNGGIPWWATLQITGQCRYIKPIPAAAISPVRQVMMEGTDERWRQVSSYVLSVDADERRETVSEILQTAKLDGWSSHCFVAAAAINRILFGGKGQLVAAYNTTMMERAAHFLGHVAVLYQGEYWDADGRPKPLEDIESWGMLDPEDPDFELTDAEAEAVTVKTFDEATVLNMARMRGDDIQQWEDQIAKAVGQTFEFD